MQQMVRHEKEHLSTKPSKASRVTVPIKDNIIQETPQPDVIGPSQIDTIPQPSDNIPTSSKQNLSSEIIHKISTSVRLPPIHPGVYTPTLSQTNKNGSQAFKQVKHTTKKPNRIHKDFRRMNDLIEYEELSHSISEFIKQDKKSIKVKSPKYYKPTTPTLPNKS